MSLSASDPEQLLALTIYALSFFTVAFLSKRLSFPGRVLLALLLFYSVAPFFQFTNFQFFDYNVTYRYDVAVFAIYTVLLWLLFAALLLFFPVKTDATSEAGLLAVYLREGLKVLWMLAAVGWAVDVVFNWSYFFLPKHEYIASLPDQTKNFLFFTIPAKEILVGTALFCPFVGRMRLAVVAFAVLAFAHSLMIGVRHVALVALLVIVLPHVKVFGLLVLVAMITFMGELSNLIKILLSPSVLISVDMVSLIGWGEFVSIYFGVSGEQKAILSNLLIKLNHPELFEFLGIGGDLVKGLPGSFLWNDIIELNSRVDRLSAFVGTAEGQGTAYSIHVTFIESLGLVIPVVIFTLCVLRLVGVSPLFVLSAEVFYSMLRNGVEYWFYLTNKLVIILLLVVCFQIFYNIIIRLCVADVSLAENETARRAS